MFGKDKHPKEDYTPSEHCEDRSDNMGDYSEEYPIDDLDFGFVESDMQNLSDVVENAKKELSLQLQKIAQDNQGLVGKLEGYLKIMAECQKETANLANKILERYALHPAIEAIDLMTSQIVELRREANSLAGADAHCPLVKSLFNSITNITKLAQAKREYLGMQAICPENLDELEPERHDVRQIIETDEAGKHRKIENTLTPGLIYHGKVLRQAKVSVYRHNPNQ
jgi:molecular chaperone GrpE (heat shock protein)